MDKISLAQEIKSRLTISSVVKSVVTLKGRGQSFVGLCPFHEEKTPSFYVRDNVARFKCFGCGAAGDVFEFIMRLRGISFTEAMADLAHKVGVHVGKKTPVALGLSRKGSDLLSIQKIAQHYFVIQLSKKGHGLDARRYLLKERGLSDRMVDQAGLGFGGSSKIEFIDYLKKQGVSEKYAMDAGLLKQGGFLHHQFLGRITFPIRNLEGEIIAFGGRSFLLGDDDGPKYVNTHSYVHYEKRKNFYGLYESKNAITKGISLLLVEGYFDAMAMWASGLPAIALCGTALSAEHVAIIKRLTSRVVICFDSDDAGLLALKKALIEFYRKDISPSMVELEKKDPGAYLADGLQKELKHRATSSIDALCYLIDRAALSAKAGVVERIKQIDSLLPVFVSIKRPLIRRQYVVYLAKNMHEDPVLLWSEIERRAKREKTGTNSQEKPGVNIALSPSERLLLEIIAADPLLITKAHGVMGDVSMPMHKILEGIALILKDKSLLKGYDDIKTLVLSIDPNYWPTLALALRERATLSHEEAERSINAWISKLDQKCAREGLKKKRQELRDFEKKRDFSSVLRSLKEQSAIVISSKQKPLHSFSKQISSSEKTSVLPPIKKDKDIKELDQKTYFDPTEDWL